MKRTFRTLSDWSRLTGRHKLAVAVLLFWAGLSMRVFLSFDPAWITAQTGNYSALTIGAFGFAAASLGLQKWADVQMSPDQPPHDTAEPA